MYYELARAILNNDIRKIAAINLQIREENINLDMTLLNRRIGSVLNSRNWDRGLTGCDSLFYVRYVNRKGEICI